MGSSTGIPGASVPISVSLTGDGQTRDGEVTIIFLIGVNPQKHPIVIPANAGIQGESDGVWLSRSLKILDFSFGKLLTPPGSPPSRG